MSVRQIQRGEGSLPVYRQISQMLRQDIQNFYQAGDVLPTEADLAQRFNVNRHTLRRAVDELVTEGMVMRHHGKGVYVLAPTIDYAIGPRTRFTETLEALGVSTQSRVIRKQTILASGGVSARLQVAEGREVITVDGRGPGRSTRWCSIPVRLPRKRWSKSLKKPGHIATRSSSDALKPFPAKIRFSLARGRKG